MARTDISVGIGIGNNTDIAIDNGNELMILHKYAPGLDVCIVDPHSLGMARRGEQVRYLDTGGYEAQRIYAREKMTKGQVLTVKSMNIGGFMSNYQFEEVDGSHNTVMFERVDTELSEA